MSKSVNHVQAANNIDVHVIPDFDCVLKGAAPDTQTHTKQCSTMASHFLLLDLSNGEHGSLLVAGTLSSKGLHFGMWMAPTR